MIDLLFANPSWLMSCSLLVSTCGALLAIAFWRSRERSRRLLGSAQAAGPTGGACFGLTWWENLSAYKATIWDLDAGISTGTVSTSVNGTSVIPALIIPVPFIARTQAAACKGLSKQLKTFIAGSGSKP